MDGAGRDGSGFRAGCGENVPLPKKHKTRKLRPMSKAAPKPEKAAAAASEATKGLRTLRLDRVRPEGGGRRDR
jgi:hypothetical protein